MVDKEIQMRLNFAKKLTKKAGEKAIVYFESIGDLIVQQKGAQDLVSNADLEVEVFIRECIAESYPNDGIVGEEHANVEGKSGYTWVIDPIDGTANFLTAIPSWCVVLACVHNDETKLGVVYEPSHNEMFWGAMGTGAFLNDKPIKVSASTSLDVGSTGIGMNGRTATNLTVSYIEKLVDRGGIFYRNASGALMLSYVAAGRLIGYAEPHMNAWDCLAAQLLIAEAGGCVENQSANDMLINGGRVVASGPGVFDEMVKIANEAYSS
ncbi:MAG: inositol monophosphatase [Amylibacter sp.]|nr:inositol monophosphatase [Amylibacter sp.]|tara:strand:+ start:1481 stop:2278 length:798 start_codon:yes stop_codon:yes gene_type:complete